VLGDPASVLSDPDLVAAFTPPPWLHRVRDRVIAVVGPDRAASALLAVAVLLAAVAVLAGWLLGRTVRPATEDLLARPVPITTSTVAPTPEPVVVHVAGAVAAEGVVELAEGARVSDALAAAGGAAPDADLDRVNLAEPLRDGARVFVPPIGGDAAPQPVDVVDPTPASGDAAAPVDVNTADAIALEQLPGVGPALAAAILSHREEHGPFGSVDDLLAVSGIGPAKLAGFRDLVVV
jgi:competence protein ComEA